MFINNILTVVKLSTHLVLALFTLHVWNIILFTDIDLDLLTPIIEENKMYICYSCGRYYKYKGGLSQHLRYECGKEPQFCCQLCPYKAKQKSTLKTHMALKHPNT